MSTYVQLVIPKTDDITVHIDIEVTLAECAAIEKDLTYLCDRDGTTWHTKDLLRSLRSLREQAEKAIAGLRFEPPLDKSEDLTDTFKPPRFHGDIQQA